MHSPRRCGTAALNLLDIAGREQGLSSIHLAQPPISIGLFNDHDDISSGERQVVYFLENESELGAAHVARVLRTWPCSLYAHKARAWTTVEPGGGGTAGLRRAGRGAAVGNAGARGVE